MYVDGASSTLFHRDQPSTDRPSGRPVEISGRTGDLRNFVLLIRAYLGLYKHAGSLCRLPCIAVPPHRRCPHRLTSAAEKSRLLGLGMDWVGGLSVCGLIDRSVSSVRPLHSQRRPPLTADNNDRQMPLIVHKHVFTSGLFYPPMSFTLRRPISTVAYDKIRRTVSL